MKLNRCLLVANLMPGLGLALIQQPLPTNSVSSGKLTSSSPVCIVQHPSPIPFVLVGPPANALICSATRAASTTMLHVRALNQSSRLHSKKATMCPWHYKVKFMQTSHASLQKATWNAFTRVQRTVSSLLQLKRLKRMER